MAPKAKDPAWVHAEVVDGSMCCKYCQKCIKGGRGGDGIHRLKGHLDGIKGQVKSCEAPLEVIGHIREEMKKVLHDYQQDKAREKSIQAEIGRKRAANPSFDYEDSPSLHSTGVRHRDSFHYIPPPIDSENTINPPKSKRRE